jgi:hypothetical protein
MPAKQSELTVSISGKLDPSLQSATVSFSRRSAGALLNQGENMHEILFFIVLGWLACLPAVIAI